MSLSLRREALADLLPGELEAVAGAGPTFTCTCLVVYLVGQHVAPVVRDATTVLPTGHCETHACA